MSVLPEEDQLYKSELLYGLAMAFSKGNDHKRAESALEESRDIKTGIDNKNGLGKVEAALDVQKAVIKGTHDSPIRKDSGTDETRDNKNMTSELRLSSDIKTYLTAIIGNAQHLKENHSEMADEEIQDVITDIETGAFNINSIINDYTGHDFVDFEQDEADLEDVNLNEVIDEVVGSLRDKLEAKGVKHIGHSTSNPITARSDREAVKNILNSVVSNAVEVTPAGKNIYSYLTVKNGKIRCEIIDEGSNSSEFHSSLSDLAKQMGSFITYESMIGGGGTFVLIFNEAKK